MKKSTVGLTLTEVLIVMTIIAIVVAIAAPVMFRSKEAAFKTVCTSNLHQMYLAMQLYRDDNGEYPPNYPEYMGFKAYYPVLLRCPSSVDDPTGSSSYRMLGSVAQNSNLPSQAPLALQEFLACRELRGGDIPIALDRNHIPKSISTDSPGFLYVARENGSIQKFQASRIPTTSGPCKTTMISRDYNY